VFILWVFICGLLGGVWFGVNLARQNPYINLPEIPLIGPAFIPQTVGQAHNGMTVQLLETERQGDRLVVHFRVRYDTPRPMDMYRNDFLIIDDQGRTYEASRMESDVFQFLENLNPSLSANLSLVYQLPAGARGLRFVYREVSLGVR
jgi:hypothetical protein